MEDGSADRGTPDEDWPTAQLELEAIFGAVVGPAFEAEWKVDASDKMDLQAGQIKTLQTCLGGVTQALSDVADGDYPGAIAALDAVEDSCRQANSLF